MHFSSSVLLFGFFALQQVVSLPTTDVNTILLGPRDDDECGLGNEALYARTFDPVKRAKCKESVECGPEGQQVVYSASKVNSAVKAAKGFLSKGTTNGSKYPEYYSAGQNAILNALPEECKPRKGLKLYEYPIVQDGSFDGDNSKAGLDRVLIAEVEASDGSKVRSYCLTMTHRGADGNEFRVCKPIVEGVVG